MNNIPKHGDVIYIDTSLHIDCSFRDTTGGKVRVASVTHNGKDCWITVEGFPTKSFNWTFLSAMQEDLRLTFGDTWAHGS